MQHLVMLTFSTQDIVKGVFAPRGDGGFLSSFPMRPVPGLHALLNPSTGLIWGGPPRQNKKWMAHDGARLK